MSRPRVGLRPVEEGDLAVFFAHQADREAAAMAGFTSRDAAAHLQHWHRILARQTVVTRTVLVDGQVAGNVVSWDHDGVREVGYWLGREHWGRGVATAALTRFLAEMPDRPLVAHVVPGNAASIRVLEKCGFSADAGARADAGAGAEANTGNDDGGELTFRLG